jgi:hypothetical protein
MILTKFYLFELVDLNGTKIFNNATVSNCIPFIKRTKRENTTISNIDEKLHITPLFTKSYKDLIQDEKRIFVMLVTRTEIQTGILIC